MDPEVSVEPPKVDDDGDDEFTCVQITLTETDGTRRGAFVEVDSDADESIAESLLQCLRGVAAMRGPGLQVALARMIGDLP